MKKYLFLGLLVAFGQGYLLASSSLVPVANLITLLHDCGEGGEIEYELEGDPNLYTYYWEYTGTADPVPDLPISLHLTGLPPGEYTLFVRDFYGCETSFTAEIFPLENCTAIHTLTDGVKKCTFNVTVEVINAVTLEPYNTDFLSIEWLDDPNAGFTRVISEYYQDFVYGYIVTAIGANGETCWYIENSFIVPGNEESCDPKAPTETRIIVNEFDGNQKERGQFVELLVLGDQECGSVTNVGGYIIDDNNGRLIPGNYLIQSTSYEQLGIDEGHLMFKYHKNWEEVPNGSLIVIYQDSTGLDSLFLTDDPTDEDEDGVYVLSADNDEYLFGKAGNWNSETRTLDYGGLFMLPSWQTINISQPADGMQVRKPDGILSHGISIGESLYDSDEEFELKLGSDDASLANCQFMQTDYFNKDHFECFFDLSQSSTPGLPNSLENDSIIFALLNCDSIKELSFDGGGFEEGFLPVNKKENISVYPNPFNGNFTLVYNSLEKGTAKLELYSISGALVFSNDLPAEIGTNRTQVSPNGLFPAGIYFVQFTFSSGFVQREYVIHIQD